MHRYRLYISTHIPLLDRILHLTHRLVQPRHARAAKYHERHDIWRSPSASIPTAIVVHSRLNESHTLSTNVVLVKEFSRN